MKEKLILIGGGGHCRSVIDVVEMEGRFEIAGIIDVKEKIGQKLLGYPIIGCDDDLEKLSVNDMNFFITIGQIKTPTPRINLYNKLISLNVNIPTIISPLAYVSKTALVGKGSVVMHHAIINSSSVVGDNCIINTKALIEHDVTISKHCHISTGAIVNGGVNIGAATFYGSGAVSKEYITIPENSFIKANSIVK